MRQEVAQMRHLVNRIFVALFVLVQGCAARHECAITCEHCTHLAVSCELERTPELQKLVENSW